MTPTTPSILILGAHGRLGHAALHAFAAAGWRVLAQTRRPITGLPAGAQAVALPLSDTAGLAEAARGVQAVVYGINPAYTRWPQELLSLARLGMDLGERLDARFMLPGNVYNFGRQLPARLDADTPQVGDTRKGALRIALEDELRQRAAAGRLRSVVIRAGDFYGGGPGSWLDLALAKDLARGRLVYPGPQDREHAWAYLPDLARAFVGVAGDGDGAGWRDWTFGGHTVTGRQLLDGLRGAAERRGLNPAKGWREGTLPWGLLRAGAWLVPMWRELAEMAYLWERPHRLDGRALAAHLPGGRDTPVDSALDAAIVPLLPAGLR